MVAATRRTPKRSLGQERLDSTEKQQQGLSFLEDYGSDQSFHWQDTQAKHRPNKTYISTKTSSWKLPKKQPYRTTPGEELRYEQNEISGDDEQERLLQEGKAYAAIFAVSLIFIFFFPSLPTIVKLIISLSVLLTTFPVSRITEAYRRVEVPLGHGEHELERRQSCGPREPIPGTLMPIHTSFADMFNIRNWFSFATNPTATDPSTRVRQEWQARRFWPEALRNYWPHFSRGSVELGKHVTHLLLHFCYFHLGLQLLVTTAQTLGLHFHDGKDLVGFFPRYWINFTSVENLFGVAGSTALRNHFHFVFNWWWGWIYGLTSLFLWHVPKFALQAVWSVIDRGFASLRTLIVNGQWREGATETIHDAKDHVVERVNATVPLEGAEGGITRWLFGRAK